LLEVEIAHVHDLQVVVRQFHFQLGQQSLVLSVFLNVIIEHGGLETILLEDTNEVSGLVLHAGDSPELISIWISLA